MSAIRDAVPDAHLVGCGAPLLASGGGGLASTAGDYLRFGRMLLGQGELDGKRIISREAAALIAEGRLGDLKEVEDA